MNKKMILLNPGPVNITERVRCALLQEDLCHRDTECAELTLDIKERLISVYPKAAKDYEAILLTGSGTCAVEAMLATLIPKDGKALVVNNGLYGEKIVTMMTTHEKSSDTVTSQWYDPINLTEVENRLNQDSTITHIIAVHHETSTGRLNDIAKLGKICKNNNVALLLDCVSSFGAEAIEFDVWNLEACAITAQKCLHSVPGLSGVIVKRSVFDTRSSAARSMYLDLYAYYKRQKQGYFPITQAVQVSYALREALLELEDMGGWIARHRGYAIYSQKIRQTLQKLGLETILAEQYYSNMLTSFKLPANYTYEQIRDTLKKSGFVIYGGSWEIKRDILRIANMGNIQPDDIERFLECFHRLLFHGV